MNEIKEIKDSYFLNILCAGLKMWIREYIVEVLGAKKEASPGFLTKA